jgi:hypothetical protein
MTLMTLTPRGCRWRSDHARSAPDHRTIAPYQPSGSPGMTDTPDLAVQAYIFTVLATVYVGAAIRAAEE